MAYRLACDAADVIAAVAPVDFDCITGPTNDPSCGACMPARPISVRQFRGLLDFLVPYEGGETSVVAGAAEFRPGERVLVFLARRLGGSLEPADLLHGTFSIERDAATGREDAVRASGAPGAERLELGHVRTLVRRALGGQG